MIAGLGKVSPRGPRMDAAKHCGVSVQGTSVFLLHLFSCNGDRVTERTCGTSQRSAIQLHPDTVHPQDEVSVPKTPPPHENFRCQLSPVLVTNWL